MENKLGRIALLRYMGIRIHNKVIKNASWIIVGRIAQSIVGMLIAMITARFLGPSNYGLINYASSIVAFAVPIMQLGLSNILVQELVNNKEKEGEIIGTAIGMSIISGILSILGILAFVAIANKGFFRRADIVAKMQYDLLDRVDFRLRQFGNNSCSARHPKRSRLAFNLLPQLFIGLPLLSKL